VARGPPPQTGGMPKFLIEHHHEASECGVVFAAFAGHSSPLRNRPTLASCRVGNHHIWWSVEADSDADALALLPPYVAERSTAVRVDEVQIP
jgi:hypothetical protein